jgi:hypothetical protein
MFHFPYVCVEVRGGFSKSRRGVRFARRALLACISLWLCPGGASAQNVTTQHYDNSRSGSNTAETILNTANVNTTSFGKLFSQSVDAQVYTQPLYMSGITISGKGTHNVIFVATENDSVYAFDADNNGGANATPLWQTSLLTSAHGAGSGATAIPNGDLSTTDINPLVGVTGTPVIDTSTNTMYLVSASLESGNYIQRLHALDIASGNEKFGGPVPLSGTVSGNGNGSSGGTLKFDTKWHNNRAGLLLLNGIVYLGFGSHGDNGPWHGWILAYNAATLQQTSVWCASANGIGAGIWMGGSGLAADADNPTGSSPGGRLFVATGNGTFDATTPYTNTMDYGDSIVRLNLNNGVMTVADDFTPLNQATLNSEDRDVAAGGVLLLPDQTTGGHTHLLVQLGKEGRISVVDRDSMGGYSSSTDNIVEEIPVNNSGQTNQTFEVGGLWGMPGYGNNTVYIWGTSDNLKSFPLSAGKISTTPSKTGAQEAGFPSPTPVISSNGTSSPIVWTVQSDAYSSGGSEYLRAYDATNVSTTLYNSQTNSSRDNPGGAVKFVVPTVINGKVYVGATNQLSVFGLLNGSSQATAPSITPGAETFTGTLSVTITDSTPGSSIFYSTTGTATTSSTPYTGPISVSTTETISAIASAPGYLQSTATSEIYTLQTQTLMPTFSPVPSSYASTQTVTISDASKSPTIYYSINAPATTSSTPFSGTATVTVAQSETLNAIATSPGLSTSPQASGTYAIGSGTGISFPDGFSTAATSMTFNGSTDLDDERLQITDGLTNEAGSAWYNTPVNIQNFTNNFTFQLSNAEADGFTFTIQNSGLTALGPAGGGLGYGPDSPGGTGGIPTSVAIKFDLYSNNGEGDDSTGLYTDGASPTTPFTDLSTTGIDLHSGDTFSVQMVYNGTTLTMTITDGVTNATFTTNWTVNIPSIVGGNTALVGFTGGTGGETASQKIETWNFVSTGTAPQPATAPIFSPVAGTYTAAQSVTITDTTPSSSIFYTLNNTTPTTTAGGNTFQYSTPVSVASSETITALATAPGFTTSPTSSAAYVIHTTLPVAPTPIITPATGAYTSAQTVSISDPGTTIFYTTNGIAPTTGSTQYTAPFIVSTTSTVQAIATESGFSTSAPAQSVITINTGGGSSSAINFASGFSAAGLQFNGHTKLDGTHLQLTDTTTTYESASAFWTTPVNVQTFTNDFTFQLTNANADGFTFTIQNAGITALGPDGGGLGYGPDAPGGTPGILESIAIKFDLYSNDGEGINSTGLYISGASPTMPATTLGGGVNLHSGDVLHAHMTYDGTTLTLTITDTTTPADTFTTSWPINIPSTVGGNTAFVGFTGGTGGETAQQEIITWTYGTSGTSIQPAAAPLFSLAAGTYSGTQTVSLTDSTPGSTIFYTLNNTTPATTAGGNTFQYSSATPISVASSETITALATASGFSTSPTSTAAYVISALSPAPTPVITPGSGTYTSAQTVTISDPGATIFYTTNGTAPTTTGSTQYTAPFVVSATTTVQAVATETGFSTSAPAQSVITINTGGGSTGGVNFGSGFSTTGLQFNGHTKLDGTHLQLTDTTAENESASAFWTAPVNIQTFTNDFTFQLTNPNADGFTFTIQNAGVTALGPAGGGLGYGPDAPGGTPGIATSVAIKFDVYNNDGEGANSTGLYTDGASPTMPATTLGGGVNLHSGDILHAHMNYDGTTLTLTITDTATPADTFTTSWPINIPSTVGGNTALVGFTAGTGGETAQQEIITWTYNNSFTASKNPVVYETANLPAVSSGPTFRTFTFASFPDSTGTILDATAVGDNVTLTVNVATAGTYDVQVSGKDLNTRGIWQLTINGAAAGSPQDEYQNTSSGTYVVLDLGNFNFAAAGNYAFKFTVTGKDAASSGYSICFDDITLTPQQ